MDTMTYQPLEDLMEYVQKNEPHVLILVGPLLDSNHEQVKENTLADTFDAAVENIIDGIAKSLKGYVLIKISDDKPRGSLPAGKSRGLKSGGNSLLSDKVVKIFSKCVFYFRKRYLLLLSKLYSS